MGLAQIFCHTTCQLILLTPVQKIVDSNDEYAILTKKCDIQEHLNNIHLIINNKTKDRLLKKYNLENLNSLINKYVEIKSKR